jgi:hypothetical protein
VRGSVHQLLCARAARVRRMPVKGCYMHANSKNNRKSLRIVTLPLLCCSMFSAKAHGTFGDVSARGLRFDWGFVVVHIRL